MFGERYIIVMELSSKIIGKLSTAQKKNGHIGNRFL